ncbi:MBL fold metallo-hydrolase [Aequorivita sp. Q41]|uniref:MBL fold metallo-hydrolase n=1 Tax=Aequorivita sp. Q41 TaxID=3153300 RepID=UPI003242B7B6
MASKLFFSTIFILFSLTAIAQTDTGEKTHLKIIKVKNNIHMLQGKGGNIGLSIGKDGIFMIDDQYADGIEQVQNEIKKISDKPIRLLINTHFHGDHTGGNSAMADSGTIIFSQENVRNRLLNIIQEEKKKVQANTLPMVTFSEDLTFNFNGEKIYVFHIHNAHTDGDAMVYFTNSNVLHTGDVFFNGKYPYIDTKNGGSILGYIAAIEKAMMVINEDTKIIPGHGNIGTFKDLQKTTLMLSNIYKKVSALYITKKTEEDILNMPELTKEYDEQGYGAGFIDRDAFLKMVYAEVAKSRKSIEVNEENNKKAREKLRDQMKEKKE